MAVEECDVLVLGGGPAGSTVAGLLAASGFHVILLERMAFPRPHIGESLTPKVDLLFHQLGVAPAMEAARFVILWQKPKQCPPGLCRKLFATRSSILELRPNRFLSVKSDSRFLNLDFEPKQ